MGIKLVAVLLVLLAALAPPAAALDLSKNLENIAVATANIPGSVPNGVRGAAHEVQERGIVSVITLWPVAAANIGWTALRSGITLGTLGFVSPGEFAWDSRAKAPIRP